MIGPSSDKSTCTRELAIWTRQCRAMVDIYRMQNLSIPRARKEKCQTRPLPCRNCRLLTRDNEPVGAVCPGARAFLPQKQGSWRPSRLTVLTAVCQRCQKRLASESANKRVALPYWQTLHDETIACSRARYSFGDILQCCCLADCRSYLRSNRPPRITFGYLRRTNIGIIRKSARPDHAPPV
jgi:hypothetical protein